MLDFNESEFFGRLQRMAAKMSEGRGDVELWLVLEGDWGGQSYLTLPWRLVREGANILRLLYELDQFAWRCNRGDGCDAYLADSSMTCWSGAEELTDALWMHEEFGPRHVARAGKLLGLDR